MMHASDEAKDTSFSKKVVIACCAAWVAYFAVYVAFKFLNPMGTWDAAFTASWFGAWGLELVMLASIRKSKIKNKYEVDQ